MKVSLMHLRRFNLVLIFSTSLLLLSCFDNDPLPKYYYTFKGVTVLDFINKDKDLSKFGRILERTRYKDLLSTYGEFTCFAPTNEAIDTFLIEKGLSSVEELNLAECDTIACMHLTDGMHLLDERDLNQISIKNMLGRYLVYSFAPVIINGVQKPGYFINYVSRLIQTSDTLTNGVVYVLDKVIPSVNLFLPQLMEKDSSISIFTKALFLTGLNVQLESYVDETYSIDLTQEDLMRYDGNAHYYEALFVKKRYFGHTAFVEPDTLYQQRGIHSVEELIQQLKTGSLAWYDPSRHLSYDDNYKDSSNILYQYVAYHLLDQKLPYERNYFKYCYYGLSYLNVYDFLNTTIADAQYYFETRCPFTIMKVTTALDGQCYINRRRINESIISNTNAGSFYDVAQRGCRISTPAEMNGKGQSALNGCYYYIDDVLKYDPNAVDALNTRIRIDDWNLSPDFTNYNWNETGFGIPTTSGRNIVFYPMKAGYVKNFNFLKIR